MWTQIPHTVTGTPRYWDTTWNQTECRRKEGRSAHSWSGCNGLATLLSGLASTSPIRGDSQHTSAGSSTLLTAARPPTPDGAHDRHIARRLTASYKS